VWEATQLLVSRVTGNLKIHLDGNRVYQDLREILAALQCLRDETFSNCAGYTRRKYSSGDSGAVAAPFQSRLFPGLDLRDVSAPRKTESHAFSRPRFCKPRVFMAQPRSHSNPLWRSGLRGSSLPKTASKKLPIGHLAIRAATGRHFSGYGVERCEDRAPNGHRRF